MLRRFPLSVPVLVLVAGLLLGLPAPGRAASSKAPPKPAVPVAEGPADGAEVQSLPVFAWKRAARAEEYQFQLAADRLFNGIVLGTGSGRGALRTRNTAATVDRTVPDGTYWWRVRAIGKGDVPGRWSAGRRVVKRWSTAPELLGPDALTVSWPASPTVLRWAAVPGAVRYQVALAADEQLASPVLGTAAAPAETAGTSLALPSTLSAGRWWWAVTPVDAEGHKGTRSRVAAFDWEWPTSTSLRVGDLPAERDADRPAARDGEQRLHHPLLSWDPVPGAASYEVEVSSAEDFPAGSKWCCDDPTTGTSLTPAKNLANNRYFWRVRALDAAGHAGQWNTGTPFTKAFYPEVRNLRLRERTDGPALAPGSTTDRPLVTWDPVPGAAMYEVQYTYWLPQLGACDWSDVANDFTATAAWAPRGKTAEKRIGPSAWPSVVNPTTELATDAGTCVRVAAYQDEDAKRGKVVSPFTYLGADGPAYVLAAHDPGAGATPLRTSAADLHPVADVAGRTGATKQLSPFLSWEHVPGARGYYVVIARDEAFTKVVDVGFTHVPAYAPLLRAGDVPLVDETTSYFYAVMPVSGEDGRGLATQPSQNAPQAFQKSSVPPEPLGPAGGAVVADQPRFLWRPAEHAKSYRLQVSTDDRFANLLEDKQTTGTSFTSSITYPQDQALFWRVRANDWNGAGLTWSRTETFRRTLPGPTPDAGVPLAGEQLPVLSWNALPGATGYQLRVDQSDGTSKDFSMEQTAFTPTQFYGTGIWRWKARATYPQGGAGTRSSAASPWSEARTFTRVIRPPTGARGVFRDGRLVLQWNPDAAAERYRVEIAGTDGFGSLIAFAKVDTPAWAPDLRQAGLKRGGDLAWRVAAIDSGGNVGAWTTGTLRVPRTLQVSAMAAPLVGTRGTLRLQVTDAAGTPLKGVRLAVRGAGIGRTRRLTTDKRGRAATDVRPTAAGQLIVEARRAGYQSSRARIALRRKAVK